MSDWNWPGADGDDDNGDEDDQKLQFAQRDSIVFLVDCSIAMFANNNVDPERNLRSLFDLAIMCVKNVMMNKIVSSDRDLMAIVFYATAQGNNTVDFKHIYVFQDLDQPSAEKIKQLENLLENGNNDTDTFPFGHSNGYSLSDALWVCASIFSKCTKKLGHKRIMLFTNEDNPHGDISQLRRQAKQKAQDLFDIGIDLELLHMQAPQQKFDMAKFYKDLIFNADDDQTRLPDPSEVFEELLTRILSKDHKKRSIGRVKFHLGEGLDLGISVYNLVHTATIPTAVKLYKTTNEEVKTVTKYFVEETGEVLLPTDKKKYQEWCGKKIYMDPDEVDSIKQFDKPGLVLMGFKPRSYLKGYYHVKPAQFIYPDESSVTGSTVAFAALLRKCIDRQVSPICKFIPRRNAPPRFVALLPQQEEVDDHNIQITPPGFHVIFLPFADDMRKLQYPSDYAKANQDQINKAKEIVKKLKIKYSPESFENPVLQKHWRNIEALALDRDAPEDFVDYTLPDVEAMDHRLGERIAQFKDMVFPDGFNPDAAAKKRAGGDAHSAAKKSKPDTAVDIRSEARAGRLGRLTVPVLKDFCKTSNINATGKKADLINAINDFFGV